MIRRWLALAATGFATVVAPLVAEAADVPRRYYKSPPRPALTFYNWNGFYVGAHAGWGMANLDQSFPADGFFTVGGAFPRTHSNRMNGLLAGAHIGYNYQLGSWVFGLEGAWTWSGLKSTFASPEFPALDEWTTKADWLATVTPRFGYAFNRWLVYGKGGYAVASIGTSLVCTACAGTVEDVAKATHGGWTLGAGFEYALVNNVILGFEYNYYSFGSKTHSGPNPAAVTTPRDVSANTQSLLGRVSYKFGSGGAIASRW
jgi:outer membrane immunogenic protein